MSSVSPSVRGKSWVFQVTALSIVLGMLLALSLKTQRQAVDEGVPSRLPALRAEFRATKEENLGLQREMAEYKARYEKLAKEQAAGLTSAKSLEESLRVAQLLAGTVPARGQGIIVTLHDSPKLDPVESREDIIENYMVHDYDIRAITNELYSAGAEAIAVNEQRLIANSSIRCVGAVVLINDVQLAPPYVIKAIGKPDVLEKTLETRGGVAEGLYLLDMIEVERASDVVIPAYGGSTKFTYARPVEQKKEKKNTKGGGN